MNLFQDARKVGSLAGASPGRRCAVCVSLQLRTFLYTLVARFDAVPLREDHCTIGSCSDVFRDITRVAERFL